MSWIMKSNIFKTDYLIRRRDNHTCKVKYNFKWEVLK